MSDKKLNELSKDEMIYTVDKMIGCSDIEGLRSVILFLANEPHKFDDKFVKFIVGYTGIYNREIPEWRTLFNSLNIEE